MNEEHSPRRAIEITDDMWRDLRVVQEGLAARVTAPGRHKTYLEDGRLYLEVLTP